MKTTRLLRSSLLLLALLCCGALKVHAALDPAKNNPMPTSMAVDLADLLVLQDDPVVADGSTPFAVRVGLYNKILNLVATSKEAHDIMYTDKTAPFITGSQDDQGIYHYAVVSGQESTLLGYSKCLDATKFRDVLCPNTSKDYTVDAQVDSNQESYVWIYLNSTNTPPQSQSRSASGYHYYQYIDDAGDYYDFYQTLNDPKSGDDNNFGGELWVGIKDDSAPTHDWTVTGNNKDGLTTYSNGGPATKVQPSSATSNSFVSKANTFMEKGCVVLIVGCLVVVEGSMITTGVVLCVCPGLVPVLLPVLVDVAMGSFISACASAAARFLLIKLDKWGW